MIRWLQHCQIRCVFHKLNGLRIVVNNFVSVPLIAGAINKVNEV